MEPKISFRAQKKHSIFPSFKPYQYNSPPVFCFFKTYFNIIFHLGLDLQVASSLMVFPPTPPCTSFLLPHVPNSF